VDVTDWLSVTTTLTVKVPGSALLAGLFFDEWPSIAAIPAAALIVAGIVLVVRAGNRPDVSGVPVME